jgi:1,4-dihydroxy-2-naphthoate octaprenyltransferase
MIKNILLSFRPKTLTASVVPIFVGTSLAYSEGFFSSRVFWSCLMASIFIQIATNLFNDAIDFKKGADTEKRIGPQRITQMGFLSSKQVIMLALGFVIMALFAGYPLVVLGGWPILLIGIFSLFLAYGYTGGPWPLAYKGWGDIFVILFFGWIAVGGVYFLQTMTYKLSAFIGGTQVGFLATVLIAINNLRDVETDKLVNKKTWAVRFGKTFVRKEILVLTVVPFALSLFWLLNGKYFAASLPFLVLPITLKLIRGIYKIEPGPFYNQFLTLAALIHMLFGLQLSLGFLLELFFYYRGAL